MTYGLWLAFPKAWDSCLCTKRAIGHWLEAIVTSSVR